MCVVCSCMVGKQQRVKEKQGHQQKRKAKEKLIKATVVCGCRTVNCMYINPNRTPGCSWTGCMFGRCMLKSKL